jgi:endonuclease/exonuclease/phosphatase family metal-dependent hydrolase
MHPVPAESCRSTSLRWISPADSLERRRLDAWCAGVGPAVILSSGTLLDSSRLVSLSDVTFVSWNVHVGNGDVRALVDDLRAGKLTGGRRVDHFVLMLQEAVRRDGVPTYTRDTEGARQISARDDSRADIVELSRALGLALIYVPSMRNGNSPENPPSDRGNAILSTLPLSDPVAVELPGERQRRVAIMATVTLSSSAANTDAVSVAAIHLDALGAARRLWVFWTPWMRELQVKSLEAALPEGAVVLGADLNTWHGKDELAVRALDRQFQRSQVSGKRVGLGLRVLDYLFLRAGDNRSARYEQLALAYGSDHRPIVGWFE